VVSYPQGFNGFAENFELHPGYLVLARPAGNGMNIRTANLHDVAAIARLADELGYPCDPASMAARIRKVNSQNNHLLLVAENDGGEICGWLHAFGADYIESGFRVEIAGLVVARAAQRSGIGSCLVKESERWAQKIGAEFINVRSNINREASHPFYEKLGYEPKKTQKVYRKRL
jgi:predicted N-acetyltransferase YhbS